jgi:hypothetical protein
MVRRCGVGGRLIDEQSGTRAFSVLIASEPGSIPLLKHDLFRKRFPPFEIML